MIQTLQAYEAFQLAYTGLLTYAHEEGDAGAEVVPGLAEEVPEPTNGGKTYTFQLREGLKYSDGTPVKASDFENTIKRLLAARQHLVVASTARSSRAPRSSPSRASMAGDISGIEANDKTGEITINLTEPDTKFLFALARPTRRRRRRPSRPPSSSSSRRPASGPTPSRSRT